MIKSWVKCQSSIEDVIYWLAWPFPLLMVDGYKVEGPNCMRNILVSHAVPYTSHMSLRKLKAQSSRLRHTQNDLGCAYTNDISRSNSSNSQFVLPLWGCQHASASLWRVMYSGSQWSHQSVGFKKTRTLMETRVTDWRTEFPDTFHVLHEARVMYVYRFKSVVTWDTKILNCVRISRILFSCGVRLGYNYKPK